jgi:hypothetical protein
MHAASKRNAVMNPVVRAAVIMHIAFFISPGCLQNQPGVCIQKTSGEQIRVTVEIARTPAQRQLGLMYRKSLPGGNGMLFIGDADTRQSFTMKNTLIPLDIIFISSDKSIVGCVENARPLTEGPYATEQPSRYVLEVNAGFCKKHGIAAGDKVIFNTIMK